MRLGGFKNAKLLGGFENCILPKAADDMEAVVAHWCYGCFLGKDTLCLF